MASCHCALMTRTEPPAHCRLVSSHDLFKMVASLDLYRSEIRERERADGKNREGEGHSLW